MWSGEGNPLTAAAAKMSGANASKEQAQKSFFGMVDNVASCLRKYSVPLAGKKEGEEGAEGAPIEVQDQQVDGQAATQPAENFNQPPEDVNQTIEELEIPELPVEPELPPDVIYMHDGQIAFKILTAEYIDRAVVLLCNHFFKDEPLGKALYLESPREVDHWLSKVLPHMIAHGMSLMAIDESPEGDGRLVGVAINSVKLKGAVGGPDDFLNWIDPQKDPKMYRIISFLSHLAEDIDFYGNYSVDKFFNFEMLNVDKTYGGRGLASMMVEQSLNLARKHNFRLCLVETTGIFSAKIFSRHGFKTIREVSYGSLRENGKLLFPNTGIHTSARVSIKLLQ
ncbi:unnamed protein product [Meganyctiphanes norvegica]|uniref:aralkylamine N-acetyltransferase n=1 Tax=Meganyctiphanes norvegica TaxID=48144 RepID=A0AAV2S785_MEGNR